jgi:hypothetical protein
MNWTEVGFKSCGLSGTALGCGTEASQLISQTGSVTWEREGNIRQGEGEIWAGP